MQRVSNPTAKVNLSNYRGIIERFLPFVLIRCVRYTNSKQIAETIAVYTFVCSYYITQMPEKRAGLPIIIDCMTDVIGEDLGGGVNKLNGKLLFKWDDDLLFAKRLAYLNIVECLSVITRHKDFITRNLDEVLLSRITTTVMEYLLNQK